MRRMKAETRRKIAGVIALLLVGIMFLSSISVLFVG